LLKSKRAVRKFVRKCGAHSVRVRCGGAGGVRQRPRGRQTGESGAPPSDENTRACQRSRRAGRQNSAAAQGTEARPVCCVRGEPTRPSAPKHSIVLVFSRLYGSFHTVCVVAAKDAVGNRPRSRPVATAAEHGGPSEPAVPAARRAARPGARPRARPLRTPESARGVSARAGARCWRTWWGPGVFERAPRACHIVRKRLLRTLFPH
jgi:hypothetical protein